MDYVTLDKAKKLESDMKVLRSVWDHFDRFNEPSDNPIEFISNFLNKCSNLSSTSEKKRLALYMIDAAKDEIARELEKKEADFEKL